MSKADVGERSKDSIERMKDFMTDHGEVNLAKKTEEKKGNITTTFVDTFRDKYWQTSKNFLNGNKETLEEKWNELKRKRNNGIDTTGLQGLYQAITNNPKGRKWVDDFFSIGNAATQTRIVCGMPDGFSQLGKAIKLGSDNIKQDWKGYGASGIPRGAVKLDLEPFSYKGTSKDFIKCRKRQCWLCGMPLYWDAVMKPEGEHILQYPMMTCFGAGPVTKLFLVEEESGKYLEEGSIISGFYSDVSSLIDTSRQGAFVNWKRRVRTFSYAWSHSHCNRHKKDKSFIKIGMKNNGDIFYYINYKAVNWFAKTISKSIENETPLVSGRVASGWMQVLDGLKKSKRAQGENVKKKAKAIGFESIYKNIMKQLIPLNLLLNQGFGDVISPAKINLNDPQNKIRANIYFNYKRLRVYFKKHMDQFIRGDSNKSRKHLANKNLLMDFFKTILKKNDNAKNKQKALLNHCFNYESDFSIGSSRGGGKIEELVKTKSDFSTYTYLPLADLLNEMTNYKNTDPHEEGVKYIMDVADETKGFDDSMNFNHLLEQIDSSDYDEGESIVKFIHGAYQTHENEFKKHSEMAMNTFISNMLIKMKFDKYGELLDYISENKGKNPNFKRGIRNNYPEAEESMSSIKEEHEALNKILFDVKTHKEQFDKWFVDNDMVEKIPYIYDIEGEVNKLIDKKYITQEIANEKYYDYFTDDIIEINDGARWETWKINLTNYIQHRTETGKIKTWGADFGELEGQSYMEKTYDFGQTYRNNLKIIQYAGLLPRMDNTSYRQKKIMDMKRNERNQERQAKMLENIKNGLSPSTDIELKKGDGMPENFSEPGYTTKDVISQSAGPQNVRALQKLNDKIYDNMDVDEQSALDAFDILGEEENVMSQQEREDVGEKEVGELLDGLKRSSSAPATMMITGTSPNSPQRDSLLTEERVTGSNRYETPGEQTRKAKFDRRTGKYKTGKTPPGAPKKTEEDNNMEIDEDDSGSSSGESSDVFYEVPTEDHMEAFNQGSNNYRNSGSRDLSSPTGSLVTETNVSEDETSKDGEDNSSKRPAKKRKKGGRRTRRRRKKKKKRTRRRRKKKKKRSKKKRRKRRKKTRRRKSK